ncbi:MAG: twin-arginine translocation signal domain-containing protein, partial [Prolixibacteraceae bacterium]|nr:twin-arginine translocation signal domain-containing protein [Prolixibacteraceae bacterium]
MSAKNYSRRDFIGRSTAGLAGAAAASGLSPVMINSDSVYKYPSSPFTSEVERLPVEKSYDYHKYLSTAPVHKWRRDKNAKQEKNEMSVPDKGWKISWQSGSGIILENAADDFTDYLEKSHNVIVDKEPLDSLRNWKRLSK